jgi:hypothetical protein
MPEVRQLFASKKYLFIDLRHNEGGSILTQSLEAFLDKILCFCINCAGSLI